MSHLFVPEAFLPRDWFHAITRVRAQNPESIQAEAEARLRRTALTRTGRLTILAADHPARLITRIGSDPFRMGNRWEYLSRIARILTDPTIDGLMATPDLIDDMLILSGLVRKAGGTPPLDGKILIGSMNRGGLAGAAFELDDTFTAYSVQALLDRRLDGGKMLFRLNVDSPDAARTMKYCADAVSALARARLFAFVEPLPVSRTEKGWTVTMTADAVVSLVGVAQALGDNTAYSWLKLPMVPDFQRVAAATSLPILVLGGDAHGDPGRLVADVSQVMTAGETVRGALMGRNILFPGDRDPLSVALAVAQAVNGAPAAETSATLAAPPTGLDFFTRLRLPDLQA